MGDKQVKKCKQRFSEETIEEWRNMTKGMKKKHENLLSMLKQPEIHEENQKRKEIPQTRPQAVRPKKSPSSLQVVLT